MNLGDVLLPYQKTWLGDKSPVKVVEKSRRIGLTWAQALDDAESLHVRAGRHGRAVYFVQSGHDAGIYRHLRGMGEKAANRGREGQRGHLQGRGRAGNQGVPHRLCQRAQDSCSFQPPVQPARQAGAGHHRRSGLRGRPAGTAQGGAGAAHVGRAGHHHFHA